MDDFVSGAESRLFNNRCIFWELEKNYHMHTLWKKDKFELMETMAIVANGA